MVYDEAEIEDKDDFFRQFYFELNDFMASIKFDLKFSLMRIFDENHRQVNPHVPQYSPRPYGT